MEWTAEHNATQHNTERVDSAGRRPFWQRHATLASPPLAVLARYAHDLHVQLAVARDLVQGLPVKVHKGNTVCDSHPGLSIQSFAARPRPCLRLWQCSRAGAARTCSRLSSTARAGGRPSAAAATICAGAGRRLHACCQAPHCHHERAVLGGGGDHVGAQHAQRLLARQPKQRVQRLAPRAVHTRALLLLLLLLLRLLLLARCRVRLSTGLAGGSARLALARQVGVERMHPLHIVWAALLRHQQPV